jgi:transposase
MRPPPVIKEWLTAGKLFQWLQSAPDEETHRRRLVIWLTYTNKMHSRKVAELLGISKQAVWLWISQYNEYGPSGLERQGRGGRRWGFLTAEQEDKILKPFIEKIKSGQLVKPIVIKEVIEKELDKKVSMPYIYRLLSRHNWSEAIVQSAAPIKQTLTRYTDFQKLSRPWLRSH